MSEGEIVERYDDESDFSIHSPVTGPGYSPSEEEERFFDDEIRKSQDAENDAALKEMLYRTRALRAILEASKVTLGLSEPITRLLREDEREDDS